MQEIQWDKRNLEIRCPTLREKCPCSEFFWSVFSHIRTEYREILRICPYSVWMWGNTDQKNSEYWHFLRSAYHYAKKLDMQGLIYVLA